MRTGGRASWLVPERAARYSHEHTVLCGAFVCRVSMWLTKQGYCTVLTKVQVEASKQSKKWWRPS